MVDLVTLRDNETEQMKFYTAVSESCGFYGTVFIEGVGPLLIGYGISPRFADRLCVAGGRLKAGCDEDIWI